MLKRFTGYRWRILALLFMAMTINYMDRSVLELLAPTLQGHVFHWTNTQYSYITSGFMFAYAVGVLIMGGVIDKMGSKKGYGLSIGVWSIFTVMHALITKGIG